VRRIEVFDKELEGKVDGKINTLKIPNHKD